jgi:hypothetical protein
MFSRHIGLKIFLLFGVVGPAELLEYFTERREPWWTVGIAVMVATIVGVLVGEWLADDATLPGWRRLGWGITAVAATIHLLVDAACVAILWLPVMYPVFSLVGVAIAAGVMVIQLVLAIRGLRDPMQQTPVIPRGGLLGAIARETSLFGGTAIAVVAVGVGIAAVAAVGIARRGWSGKVALAGLFFVAVALCGVGMGIERRALALGLPVPWSGWLRWPRSLTYYATQEGLLLIRRCDAVLYRWEWIESVEIGTMGGLFAIRFMLAPDTAGERLGAGTLTAEDGARWRSKEVRSLAMVRALTGADIAVIAQQTVSGLGPLRARISSVMADPEYASTLPSATELLEEAGRQRFG